MFAFTPACRTERLVKLAYPEQATYIAPENQKEVKLSSIGTLSPSVSVIVRGYNSLASSQL